jgi:hypothetical protein
MNRHPIAIPALILLAVFWIVMLTHLILNVPTADAHAGHRTCATVNNRTNSAAWTTPIGTELHLYTAHYSGDDVDRFGRLIWDAPVPRAVRLAEVKLRNTPDGFKIARACA